ncbi:MAG TPA: hypothetical protein DCQ26_06275 [Marinilabiliales bacterium]|nr:MAG: hypothetical protein A2W95_04075 [Bacteroidetes bacterium GWA2_40_14]OFX58499.1 MAG: hypothetical protein A2W84_08690 [Bacteroidetes bacterium GWC2_40_13]OFX74121.1 MAG: hypothetical protein A2W96_12500 [Bacteroidetes bacterium GWD2_40_43]OFX93045.1 MAG: hypothetical protein A2W97_05575 [Bacteroidetes bacterium GWE2_40_63]OFY21415.1 MAG: hypothetical protein A2W88_09575 [Bacteroidetes bacterium GWF2_40_13]OFZ27409.1 MAG: hypothetical protein A2437_14050 [Bacteroidetes bacterium RIFOXYC
MAKTTKRINHLNYCYIYPREQIVHNIRQNEIENKGYKCYADKKNEAVILYDGIIYKYTARDFNNIDPDGYLTESGKINWVEDKFNLRYKKATFENDMCKNCNLIPACFGPCSQKIVESQSDDDLKKFCLEPSIKKSIQKSLLDFYQTKVCL